MQIIWNKFHILWNEYIEMSKKRELNTMINDADDIYEGLLKCEYCGSFRTRYITLQTRSADEPCTIFARCLECKKTWSDNGKS